MAHALGARWRGAIALLRSQRCWVLLVGIAISLATPSRAPGQLRIYPRDDRFWLTGATAFALTAPLDMKIGSLAARLQRPSLDHLSQTIATMGSPRYPLSLLAIASAVPRAFGERDFSDAALRISIGYAAAEGANFILKRIVGRHRPDTIGGAARFRPLHGGGDWGSMPSGHATQAFSIAAGLALETNERWVATTGYSLATLVGAQRVYSRSHWTSDVIVGAVVSMAVSATTIHWLENSGGFLKRR